MALALFVLTQYRSVTNRRTDKHLCSSNTSACIACYATALVKKRRGDVLFYASAVAPYSESSGRRWQWNNATYTAIRQLVGQQVSAAGACCIASNFEVSLKNAGIDWLMSNCDVYQYTGGSCRCFRSL